MKSVVKKSILSFYVGMIVLSLLPVHSFAQNRKIDSLIALLKVDKQDSDRLKDGLNLCIQYRIIGEYEVALKYSNDALVLSKQDQLKRYIASAYINIGAIYYYTGEYNKALENYFSSLKMYNEMGNKSKVASAYGNIGLVYEHQGDYTKALESYLAACKIQDVLNDKKGKAIIYNNIAIVYFDQSQYDKALEYDLASLDLKKQVNDKLGISSSYNNIGNLYYRQRNYPLALKNYFQALKIREDLGDRSGIASSYNNIGSAYSAQGNTEKGFEYYFNSFKIKTAIGDKKGVQESSLNLCESYLKKKNIPEAKKYALKSLALSKEIGTNVGMASSYRTLSKCDSMLGDFKTALADHRSFKQYNDSSFNEVSAKKTAQMSAQYESEKKDNEIKLLGKDKENQKVIDEAERNKQKTIIWMVALGFALILLFSIIMYRRWRFTKRQKLTIEMQKQLVEEKQKEILDSIYYAKRIQTSLLPTEKYIDKNFKRLLK